jgi:hypothetical protein
MTDKQNYGRLLTEFRDGTLRVEYFGKKDPQLDAQIEAAVGKRHTAGKMVAELGRFAEERQTLNFQVAAEEVDAIRERLRAIPAG